jgi:prepilin signal peptidase PulO-like enzyme (type II secretory pathway)
MNSQVFILVGVFVFAVGACVGSFLNVVIWRLPYRGREVLYQGKRGRMTLSWPPSHCPVCDSPIRWYQNIPVFSWLFLKAKCANCRTHIPVRYPLVELGTALLFIGFFLAYFVGHWPIPCAIGGGPPPAGVFQNILQDYPQFALHLVFIASLLAASAIDIDLYIIPLSIPYFIMALGIVAAIFLPRSPVQPLDINSGWWMARPIIGAALGLVLVNLLMLFKILPRSFSGEIAAAQDAETEAKAAAETQSDTQEAMSPPPKLTRFAPSAIATIVLLIANIVGWTFLTAPPASLITVISGIAIFLIGVLPRDAGQVDVTDEVMEEISSPFARREVAKELWFLGVPILCAFIAYWIPIQIPTEPWIARLLATLLGILVGGGIVWMIRICGTLYLNKEAMGMGDAHLMAGVGAILGAPLIMIAFFMAPFVALAWAAVLKAMGKPNILPYGPWLSVASILCLLLGNSVLCWYLGLLFH